jgi:hypothetical protein
MIITNAGLAFTVDLEFEIEIWNFGLFGTHRKNRTNPICGFHRKGAKASTATVAVTGTFTNDTLPV